MRVLIFLTYLWLFLAFWSVLQHFINYHIRAVHCSSTDLLDRSSIKKSRKNDKKKTIGPSVFAISVCLCVCLCVRSLKATLFGLGGWFSAWRILGWTVRNNYFFLKFWDLTYLLLFLVFLGDFCYISSVNFERVCRPIKWHRDFTEIRYMGSLYGYE